MRPDRLCVAILVRCVIRPITAKTRLFESPERGRHRRLIIRVDPDRAGIQALSNVQFDRGFAHRLRICNRTRADRWHSHVCRLYTSVLRSEAIRFFDTNPQTCNCSLHSRESGHAIGEQVKGLFVDWPYTAVRHWKVLLSHHLIS